MLYPSIDEVRELLKSYTTVPVFFTLPADHRTPISIFTALSQGEDNAFLLESVNNGTQWDRYSFIGFHPVKEIRGHGTSLQITENGASRTVVEPEPFRYLQGLLDAQTSPKIEEYPYFTGGFIGYFAYDAVRYTEKKLTRVPDDDIGMPDLHLFGYDTLVAFDHLNSNAIVIVNIRRDADIEEQYRAAEVTAAQVAAKIDSCHCRGQFRDDEPAVRVTSNVTREEYMGMVQKAKEYITAGDIFQVVLSQRFEVQNPPDSFEVYRRLRATNPSPYLYYFKTKDYEISGASPELLVKVNDGIAATRPIAGTRPRGKTHAEDRELEKSLLADEKERAEHTMLVDLGRNDLGRVSRYGSVEVTDFMRVERYSKVMHLVSDVQGRLREDCKPLDALRAVLPAGTLSGAPKVRAMEIIDELENRKRGLYGGTVGYFGFNGDMNTCIAIRTILFHGDKAYVQAGAGIVADSDPEREYEETAHKAGAMLNALKEARK
ncbi:MAG: anthranilate synthase component I [Oscillospiraceae bacterium]|nr:anthranilate synthase component I [Oscillospiraceae bacterium]